jgi:hypothetical protein
MIVHGACFSFVYCLSFIPLPLPSLSHSPQAEEADDGYSLSGTVEFADVATAKAVVEKYNGMDVGGMEPLKILPA